MIYISFDIGVKNLAICILKHTNIIQIIDWRIITLAETKKEFKGIDDITERIFTEMDNVIGQLKELGIDLIDYVFNRKSTVKFEWCYEDYSTYYILLF